MVTLKTSYELRKWFCSTHIPRPRTHPLFFLPIDVRFLAGLQYGYGLDLALRAATYCTGGNRFGRLLTKGEPKHGLNQSMQLELYKSCIVFSFYELLYCIVLG